jgi:putative membrane protein
MVKFRLTDEDQAKVSAAIAKAEAGSSGEIVAVATPISDPYHDVGLHWAVAVMILVLAWAAWCPSCLSGSYDALMPGWRADPTLGELLTFLMVLAVLKFTVVLLVLKWMPLRLALTPGATKQRRVRRRAIAVFKAAAERRTVGRTGILIYLSVAERRAEIIADEAITKLTTPETWGEAMAALLVEVKQGRPGDGIVAAVERVGAVLAEHFPRSATDTDEIPNKLILL